MKPRKKTKRFVSIGMRTALLSWVVAIASVLLFVILIVPHEKQYFLGALNSKAEIVEASVRDVAAASLVADDYSELIDHCVEILKNSEQLKYLVITRADGFSLIHQQDGWRIDQLDSEWRSGTFTDENDGGIINSALAPGSVYHYSSKLRYAGVDWGWLHVGLGLDEYKASVGTVYERISRVMLLCLILGLLASILYANRMIRPLRKLERMAHQVATGNLSVSEEIKTNDEVELLAHSFNEMTQSLRRRDTVVQSVRFAAEYFLKESHWEAAVDEVLAKLGPALQADRMQIFECRQDNSDQCILSRTYEWKSSSTSVAKYDIDTFSSDDPRMEWIEELKAGVVLQSAAQPLDEIPRMFLKEQGILSLILVPVLVDDIFWGCFWIEDWQSERQLSNASVNSMIAVAEIFSSAIQRSRIQQMMIDAVESAESANKTKSLFLATMSHEIRTPMNGIIGTASLLEGMELTDDQYEYVQLIQSSGDALLKLLNDILDFSKIEAGKLSLINHPFNLHETCERILDLLSPIAEEKGIDLFMRFAPAVPPQVIGDYGRIRQVLMNLISNAVKFTSKGFVYISVDSIEQNGEEALIEFRIQDTGIGIPKDKTNRLFHKFSQADDSNTRKYGGTGLGLAISKELVLLMDGEIGVESTEGKGSCFWFNVRFPIEDNNELEWMQKMHFNRERVVLLDKNRAKGATLSERLIHWGLETSVCDTEDQLINMAPQEDIRLIIIEEDSAFKDIHQRLADTHLKNTEILLIAPPGLRKPDCLIDRITKPVRLNSLLDYTTKKLGYGPVLPERQKRSKPHKDKQHGKDMKVLIVEDNDVNQIIARRMLNGQGAEVDIAANGEIAVLLTRVGHDFDLILMDCQMPCMDGYEASRTIRQNEEIHGNPYTPIVAMTANAMQDEYTKCIEAGMDDYLSKPIKTEQIAKILQRYAKNPKS